MVRGQFASGTHMGGDFLPHSGFLWLFLLKASFFGWLTEVETISFTACLVFLADILHHGWVSSLLFFQVHHSSHPHVILRVIKYSVCWAPVART